jgi:hypothetical protein
MRLATLSPACWPPPCCCTWRPGPAGWALRSANVMGAARGRRRRRSCSAWPCWPAGLRSAMIPGELLTDGGDHDLNPAAAR